MADRNILLKIAYDGTGFSGWQRQPGKKTACGALEEALTELFGFEIKVDGVSRTDAGVHALMQCASFTVPEGGIPTDRIPLATNRLLAKDRLEGVGEIEVLSAEEMPPEFHARYSAKGKRYIYRIYNSPVKSVFRRTQFYQIAEELDLIAMRTAAEQIVGTHDFAAFQTSGGTPRESTVRTVHALKIEKEGEMITIAIEGDGFLYNMVRIIVGTLVEVGLGKRPADSVAAIIESKDRGNAGHTAPPQGLYLAEVFY